MRDRSGRGTKVALSSSTINLGIASFSISRAYHSISSLGSVASQPAYRRTPSPNASPRPFRSSPNLLHRRRFRSRFERPNPRNRRNPGCSPKFHLCGRTYLLVGTGRRGQLFPLSRSQLCRDCSLEEKLLQGPTWQFR